MAWMDPLTANLLDLLAELREHPIPLTIGGGFRCPPRRPSLTAFPPLQFGLSSPLPMKSARCCFSGVRGAPVNFGHRQVRLPLAAGARGKHSTKLLNFGTSGACCTPTV
jgi:hypothetical protein